MARQEKEFVDIARGREELSRKMKAWENTIKRDGRKDRGHSVIKVSRGGQPPTWWIYILGPQPK